MVGYIRMTSKKTAKICLITTGGTISSIYDEETQALHPGLSVDALLDRLPKDMGNIEVIKREITIMVKQISQLSGVTCIG